MTVASATRGRPRDPAVEDKILDATITVYGEHGWSGFTLDAVARSAGVGREALYRRWSGKAELLAAAVAARSPVLGRVDTGNTRHDLEVLARHFLASYREPHGIVGLRMVLDAKSVPELAEHFQVMTRGERGQQARQVIKRAIARGDLPAQTSVSTVVAILTGATLTHVLYGAASGHSAAADERHVQSLISLVLTE
ncbi:MAG: TetR/AcrR family transcriptional regulator [Jatrophihabitantaceae bacterium]